VRPVARRWVWNGLRLAVTAALLVLVFRMIRWDEFADRFDRSDKGLFFAMVAALAAPVFILSLRWWLLLRAGGFPLPLSRAFFVTYAGAFFNNFLPGSVGGDITKSVLVAAGEERKAAVVATVILDRAIGLAVMIVLGAACLAPFVGRFSGTPVPFVVYGLLGAMGAGYAVYFNPALRERLRGRLPFWSTIAQLDSVFRLARDRKGLVAVAALLSVAGQAATIVIIYGLSRAIGVTDVGLWAFFVFEPIIFIATAVVPSMGGWGVQEFAYQTLFGLAGMAVSEAVALSVLYKIGVILVSVPGGVLFAMGAARDKSNR
jgi:hypothetical protein